MHKTLTLSIRFCLPLLFILNSSSQAQETEPSPEEYLGRKIATTMHWSGAAWLIRDSREREEASSLMIEQLKVQPGQTVCDLGCGNGFHTLDLAQKVAPSGKTIAVDIQAEMLELLQERAKAKQIEGIETILGDLTNPNLPIGSIDLVLLVDVYHEFSHPVEMLNHIKASLAPEGRVVLVEFRAEDDSVPIKPDHKMSRDQILKEMRANGLVLDDSFEGLPWQHMLFFKKASIHNPKKNKF